MGITRIARVAGPSGIIEGIGDGLGMTGRATGNKRRHALLAIVHKPDDMLFSDIMG
jgi:hypothetical protein